MKQGRNDKCSWPPSELPKWMRDQINILEQLPPEIQDLMMMGGNTPYPIWKSNCIKLMNE